MDHNPTNRSTADEQRKRVFISHAQVLSDEQRQSLSETEKAYEDACSDRGVWLDVFCPDDACISEAEKIRIPVFCADQTGGKKTWLDLFCPEGSCEVDAASKLP